MMSKTKRKATMLVTSYHSKH